ncbi:hypothetical protein CDIK_4219, partial [Cucumispora dikerogammari]
MRILTITQSKRNKPRCIDNGFIYNLHSTKDSINRWRCQNRKCTGILLSNKNNKLLSTRPHTHDADFSLTEKELILINIKKRATETKEQTLDILADVYSKISEEVLIALPKTSSLRDSAKKARNKTFVTFQPEYEDFPESLKITLRGGRFLQHDSGINDPDRIVVFYSNTSFDYLKRSTVIMMDGTFKICPPTFYQIYTLHGQLFGKSYPLVYVIMKNKKERSYKKAFDFINQKHDVNPRYIILDFETAAINAARNAFHESDVKACLFHYGQAIWRKVQALGLTQLYKENNVFKKMTRMLLNLAFVPEKTVIKSFESIIEATTQDNTDQNIQQFIDYFETTYIRKTSQEETKPLFSISLWSCNTRIINNSPRTTNAVESWHRTIKRKFETPHPNMSKLLDTFQKEEELVTSKLIRSMNGKLDILRKNFKKEFNLKIVIENYENYKNLSFFKALDSVYE